VDRCPPRVTAPGGARLEAQGRLDRCRQKRQRPAEPRAAHGLAGSRRAAPIGAYLPLLLSPTTPSSCHLWQLVRVCTGSLLQPRPHRGFLRHPLSGAGAQKAAQARQARLHACLRPAPLPLLPQRLQPQPPQQPTAHYRRLGRGGGPPERAQSRRRLFVQRPRYKQCPHRRCHTGAVLTAHLISEGNWGITRRSVC